MQFCTDVLPTYGMRARRPLPASARTILLYLSFLSDEGRVHEGSLNPYLAAVNQMHEDSGLEKPGTTHFVRLARKGFAAVEAEGGYRPDARVPVPAPVMLEILRLGLKTDDNSVLRLQRGRVCRPKWHFDRRPLQDGVSERLSLIHI